jgi:hypothetical protein
MICTVICRQVAILARCQATAEWRDFSHSRGCLLSADCAPCHTGAREVGKLRYNSLLHAPQYTDRFKQLEHFITAPYHMEGRGKGRKPASRGRGIQQSYNPIRNPGVISPKPRPPILEKPALRFARSIIFVRKKNSRFCTSYKWLRKE